MKDRMSLNDVWEKYYKEHKSIKKHNRREMILGLFLSATSILTGYLNSLNNNEKNTTIILSTLFIAFGYIAIFLLLHSLIGYCKENKLNDWLEKYYTCPHCKLFLGNSSPSTLQKSCSKCSLPIDYSTSKSVENLNLNLKGWENASALFCTFLAALLFYIAYCYPYSFLNLNINPHPAIRMLANDMVFVKGGSMVIGATEDQKPETDEFPDEHPDTTIEVSNFYICKHEVTQDLWKEVMGDNPSHHQGDKLPMESVSYIDCLTFIKKLNKKSGNNYRLPTEIEWEYAARGGRHPNHTKYAGSQNIEDVAWYDQNSGKTTHEVCLLGPNELGLYGMNGNVLEWCQSFYTKDYSTKEPSLSQKGDTLYVLRGGSFDSEAARSRVAFRVRAERKKGEKGMGLRLVKE